jgi:hypothetical protein
LIDQQTSIDRSANNVAPAWRDKQRRASLARRRLVDDHVAGVGETVVENKVVENNKN